MYSRNIKNLFLAGRIMSMSHVAFGSTRVQGTLGQAAQAVGLAAAKCIRDQLIPVQLSVQPHIQELQQALLRRGQFIPGVKSDDPSNLARTARISASSSLRLAQLPPNGPLIPLAKSWAQMLPVNAGPAPRISCMVDVTEPTTLRLELRTSDCPTNYTPDVMLATKTFELNAGQNQQVVAEFGVTIDAPRYVFFCLMQNPAVFVRGSEQRLTGILSVSNGQNPAVSNYGKQVPPGDIGVETFEFWIPERRPAGHNMAITIDPPLEVFAPLNVINGWGRPTDAPNAWVAALDDPKPTLRLEWDQPQTIAQICLAFDTDFDHPMESVQWGHPEAAMPFCVRHYRLKDAGGSVVAECLDNHQSRNWIRFDEPIMAARLEIELLESHGAVPAALFEVACYHE